GTGLGTGPVARGDPDSGGQTPAIDPRLRRGRRPQADLGRDGSTRPGLIPRRAKKLPLQRNPGGRPTHASGRSGARPVCRARRRRLPLRRHRSDARQCRSSHPSLRYRPLTSPPGPHGYTRPMPETPNDPTDAFVRVRGANENNLRNVDVDVPRDRIVAFTGVSGSGKSSLAFGTIFTEAQRRYLESVAPYARRLIQQGHDPHVESISGLPPAVALQQRRGAPSSRSSVGTVT